MQHAVEGHAKGQGPSDKFNEWWAVVVVVPVPVPPRVFAVGGGSRFSRQR